MSNNLFTNYNLQPPLAAIPAAGVVFCQLLPTDNINQIQRLPLTLLTGSTSTPEFLRVGINTPADPVSYLKIRTILDLDMVKLEQEIAAATAGVHVILRRAQPGPANIGAGNRIAQLVFRGYNSAAIQDGYGNAAFIRVEAVNVFSNGTNGVDGRMLLMLNLSNVQVTAATLTGALFTLGVPLQLSNAAVAGAVVPTHTVVLQDATGTAYRVPCLV